MENRAKVHAALLVLLASAVVYGCATIFDLSPLHDESASEAGPSDASPVSDASDAFAPDTSVTCTDPGYPDRPDADSPDAGDFTILVAVNRIDFGLHAFDVDGGDGGGPRGLAGFNLDRKCTVDTNTQSCASSVLGTDFTNYVVDKTSTGMDNAGDSLIQYIGNQGPTFTPEAINQRLQAGQYGVVLQVTGYNGQPNDTQVAVSFFPSFGVATDGGIAFDHTDVWRVDHSDMGGADTSQWLDTTAYVRDGKLVAHFSQAPLKITVNEKNPILTLRFNDAVMTSDIVLDQNNAFRLTNGVVAGRIKTEQFLAATDQLFYSPTSPDTFICTNDFFQHFIHTTVCNARDIRSNSLDDNTNKPCDAFSGGAGFDTYAVDKWISGNAPVPLEAGCPPVNDCRDL